MTEALTEALEAAEAAMLEAAYRWLVARDVVADGEFYGDTVVWGLISRYYPAGEVGFRHNPSVAENVGVKSYLPRLAAPLSPAEAAAVVGP